MKSGDRVKGADVISLSHVVCDDPFDLRPAARTILHRIRHAVNMTPPEQPVVVLMGEHHERAADIMLQHLVLSRLQGFAARREIDIAVGIEHPVNTLNRVLNESGVDTLPPEKSLTSIDPNGWRILKVALGRLQGSPLAVSNLYGYCLKNRLKIQFNDLADKALPTGEKDVSGEPVYDYYLEVDHPQMHRLFEQSGHEPKNYRCRYEPAVSIRNIGMVENAMSHLGRTNAKIYVQLTGSCHVMGYTDRLRGEHSPYERSLSALFEKAGAHVIPVLNNFDLPLPSMPTKAHAGMIYVTGLSQHQFKSSSDTLGQQRRFMRKIIASSGNEIELLEQALDPAPWHNHVQKVMPLWARQAHMA